MKLEYAGMTDVGLVRPKNEDAILLLPAENLFAVADGMGGHRAGEVAAGMVVEAIESFFLSSNRTEPSTWPYIATGVSDINLARLSSAVQFANQRVLEANKDRGQGTDSMGATLVALYFVGGMAITAHAGDCRCYRYRRGSLKQLTLDHTVAEELQRNHGMTREEAEGLTAVRHVVTRALGVGPEREVQADVGVTRCEPGDLFLLCSDGLHDELPPTDIAESLGSDTAPVALSEELVARAKANGGRDNVSVVLVRFLEGDSEPEFPIEAEDTKELPRDRMLGEETRPE